MTTNKKSMSADKRSVTTDALATLGTIIEDGGRDAIHLAVEPVIAGEHLWAGQHIGIVNGNATTKVDKKLGIVDPFVQGVIPEGAKFWLVVYPRQITSLRHVWEHPDFDKKYVDPEPEFHRKQTSEKWLRDWCQRTEDAPTYEELIEVITTGEARGEDFGYGNVRWRDEGEYLLSVGRDASGEIPFEVKHHLEVVTGKTITSMPEYFSCSC